MRTTINNVARFALLSSVALSADTDTGNVPAIDTTATVATVEPTTEATTEAKPVRAKRAKPATDKPTDDKPAKPAKRAKPVAAVEPVTADPRAAKAERVAADRSAVSALYAAFETNRDSVPVKPLSAFKPSTTTAHPIARNPSTRQAAAISLAFAASGKKLAPGTSAPRVFEINGVRSCIENGVLRDAVSSGLITVSGDSPETEMLRLAPKADKIIVGLIGERAARAGKLTA